MALWHCRRCGTDYAVGLAYCPQCTSTDHEEVGAMPKISKAAGASNGVPVAADEEPVEAPAAGALSEPVEGDGTGEALPELEVGPVRPPRPSTAAAKAEWIAHAVTLGLVEEAAASLSKRDLVAVVEQVEAGEVVVGEDGMVVAASDPVG